MKSIAFILVLVVLLSSCGRKGKARERHAAKRVEQDLNALLSEKGLKLGAPIFIRAFKEERVLELFVRDEASGTFELLRSYPIVAASGSLGPKLAEGDGQVPEGFYFVGPGAMNPNSSYHLSFNIGYPNAYDRAHDRTGSYIMIHGSNVSIGCLAMSDEKIEEIYTLANAALDGGQAFFRVHIFPFRMTEERMANASSSPHHPFWENLKTGYDLFEESRIPPNVTVEGKKYAFD